MSVGWQYSGDGDGVAGGGADVDDGGGTCGVNYIKYVVAVAVAGAVAFAVAVTVINGPKDYNVFVVCVPSMVTDMTMIT
uniref:Uncharacterized protein n=1 Tax=Glossina austeni TaxID=7395 RepID=A0A1A9UXT7_GLOAU